MRRLGDFLIGLGVAIPVVIMLAMLVTGVLAVTSPIDDAGRPMPVVSFIGTGGQGTPTSTTDRFPVDMSSTTTSSTDATGWGRRWFFSSITFQTGDNEAAAWFADETTAYVMAGGVGGINQEIYRSTNRGASYTFVGTTDEAPGFDGFGTMHYIFRTTLGTIIEVGAQTNTATRVPHFSTNPIGPWNIATLPGGFPSSFPNGGIAQQGSTLLLAASEVASDVGRVLRSINDGVSWSSFVAPTGLQGFTQNPGTNTLHNTTSVASPTTDVWLVIDNDGRIFRSTDDGVTFAQVHKIDPISSNDFTGITCSTSTICVAWQELAVVRSTDAGVTWTQVATFQVQPRTMVSFGQGVIVGLSAIGSTLTPFRSQDNGLTWEQLPAITPSTACTIGNWTGITVHRNGAASLGWDCTNPGAGAGRHVVYSPVAGAGDRSIIGDAGVRWDIGSDGGGKVTQGAGAINSGTLEAWQTSPVQRSTLLNQRVVSAANTAVSITITAVANQRAHVYSVDARCSAGTASLTITDGGTTIWDTQAGAVGTANFVRSWITALTGATNSAMVVTLGACGAGNTGTLMAQADRF